MNRALTLAALLPLAFSLACGTGTSAPAIPVLADLNPDASGVLGLVDRSAELTDAEDYDLAEAGRDFDLAGAGDGFQMVFGGEQIVQTGEGAEVPPPSFSNFQTAWGATLASEAFTLAVVGPPRIAIGVAAAGQITQIEANVWHATNTVDIAGRPVTADLTVAWVGVGWLAEMRITDPASNLNQAVWFNGFLSVNAAVGWWDIYDANHNLAGVVEWIADGQGSGQFGIAAVNGAHAGSTLSYLFVDDTARIDLHDASIGEDSWVFLAADHSGEVRLPDHLGGAPGCWDVDLLDTACPE